MALWTFFGLASGKATTNWPRTGEDSGQQGVLGMPRYNPAACREGCAECAAVCPTHAIEARAGGLAVDYGRCVVCQLCTEACPTDAMTPSEDWAFGVTNRQDLMWSETSVRARATATPERKAVSPQPAHSPCRRRLVQRLRVGTAGPEQPLLQSASARDLLHRVPSFRRSPSGHWPRDQRDARAIDDGLRGDGRSALGDGGGHMRGIGRNFRRQLRLGDRSRRRSSGRRLFARLPAEPGRDHGSAC